METMPMALDALSGGPDALNEFRISAPREIVGMFRQFYDANITLHLNASDGHVVNATVWAMDMERGALSLAVEADDPVLPLVLDCGEIVAVGYLDSVKVQFDLDRVVLVRGAQASVLSCAFPGELYRFQRRSTFRVRPSSRNAPTARLRHGGIAEMTLSLRVLDVSIGGCALFMPDDVPPLQPGAVYNNVRIELDPDTGFYVDLRLQHVTSLGVDNGGVRLGCEFVRTDSDTLRTLQRFIDQTQKRGRLMSLT